MSEKDNCTCNTQAFYVDRQCTNHSTIGFPEYEIGSGTITNVATGETINASDVNTIKNNIRLLIKKFNGNSTLVSSRGSAIPLNEASNYISGKTITDTTFNNIKTMSHNVGSTYNTSVSDGQIIKDDEWLALIAGFNVAASNCMCNTDCSCNTVCSIVTDCGCNYS